MFDFGNKKTRDQPVDVDVASGVPCGIAARRGELHHLCFCNVFCLHWEQQTSREIGDI